jgi:hypothetical protein
VKGERERREEAGEYELGDGKTNQYETYDYAAGKAGPRQRKQEQARLSPRQKCMYECLSTKFDARYVRRPILSRRITFVHRVNSSE